MSERYLVRCSTSHPTQPMSGIYAASLTTTGMVATWKEERAARYDSKATADNVASRLARKFTGTAWEVCHG